MKKLAVLIAIILIIAIGDMALTYNSVITNNSCFEKNDFEITQASHSDAVWDKVIFGNTAVLNAYIEEQGTKGYVNLGFGGVQMTDLEKMLATRHVRIGTELVIGLDYKLFCGEENVEYEYIWNKKIYEPYLYFERERLVPVIKELFDKKSVTQKPQSKKSIKRGVAYDKNMSDLATEYETLATERSEENVKALEAVIEYCTKNEIRIRAVWMPYNPMYDRPSQLDEVHTRVNAVLATNGIEVYDMENAFAVGDFYDITHLNYDTGSPKFTALIEEWL